MNRKRMQNSITNQGGKRARPNSEKWPDPCLELKPDRDHPYLHCPFLSTYQSSIDNTVRTVYIRTVLLAIYTEVQFYLEHWHPRYLLNTKCLFFFRGNIGHGTDTSTSYSAKISTNKTNSKSEITTTCQWWVPIIKIGFLIISQHALQQTEMEMWQTEKEETDAVDDWLAWLPGIPVRSIRFIEGLQLQKD